MRPYVSSLLIDAWDEGIIREKTRSIPGTIHNECILIFLAMVVVSLAHSYTTEVVILAFYYYIQGGGNDPFDVLVTLFFKAARFHTICTCVGYRLIERLYKTLRCVLYKVCRLPL